MKKLILIWILLMTLFLPACANHTEETAHTASQPTASSLEELPTLMVIYGEQNLKATRRDTSWDMELENGLRTSINAEVLPLLQRQETTPFFTLSQDSASQPENLTAHLLFDKVPDQVLVRCWDDQYWGNTTPRTELPYDTIPVTSVTLSKESEGTQTAFQLNLKASGAIYEIIAKWTTSKESKGTIHYAFYTTEPAEQ